MRLNRTKLAFFFISLLFILPGLAMSQAASVKIRQYVVDNANVFDAGTELELTRILTELEQATNGVQFVVFTEAQIPSDTTLEERTLSLAEENGIEKQGADNGVLLYLATEDRQYRWEVGYGMESTLNTPLLGRLSRQYMVPDFQAGNYGLGILKGIDAASKVILGSTDPDIVKLQSGDAGSASEISTGNIIIFSIIVLLALIMGIMRFFFMTRAVIRLASGKSKKEDKVFQDVATLILLGSLGGRRGGRGGFGGGGFGGFSGGGGSFGGGGFGGRFINC